MAVQPRRAARITKRIPVAAGLGGGSSDAATALRLANETLDPPLPPETLRLLAKGIGADVPFFLTAAHQLGRGEGANLEPLALPQDYWVVLLTPHELMKESTRRSTRASTSAAAPRLRRAPCADLERSLAAVRLPRDLAALPPNDLVASPLADELRDHGAFRADVTGAGSTVFALFHHRRSAEAARRAVASRGRIGSPYRLGTVRACPENGTGRLQAPHAPMRRPQSRRYVSSRRSLSLLSERVSRRDRAQFLGRPIP